MDALLTITVFFLSSVIWNEWKVVVIESQAKHVKVVGVVVVDMVGELFHLNKREVSSSSWGSNSSCCCCRRSRR